MKNSKEDTSKKCCCCCKLVVAYHFVGIFSIFEISLSIYFAVVDQYRYILFAILEVVLVAFYLRGCIGKLSKEQVQAKKYFTIIHLVTFILNAIAFIVYFTIILVLVSTQIVRVIGGR